MRRSSSASMSRSVALTSMCGRDLPFPGSSLRLRMIVGLHITDDAAGYKLLLDLLAEYGDTEEGPDPGRDRDLPRPAGRGPADRGPGPGRDRRDRARFADARGLKTYAGASPVTRASGRKSGITRRWAKNDRLNHVGYLGAFSTITASPGEGALPAAT
ncbi:transposase [Kitasatospora sp. NPDC002551]|uniref:transposase n=1 Tax=Kitasatospora sp. NPDC002551 TaxID=3154539 RepID=UPI003329202F